MDLGLCHASWVSTPGTGSRPRSPPHSAHHSQALRTHPRGDGQNSAGGVTYDWAQVLPGLQEAEVVNAEMAAIRARLEFVDRTNAAQRRLSSGCREGTIAMHEI